MDEHFFTYLFKAFMPLFGIPIGIGIALILEIYFLIEQTWRNTNGKRTIRSDNVRINEEGSKS